MADPFESAWLKWAGGVVEARVLADNINAVAAQEPPLQMPVTLYTEYDAKCHCLVYSVVQFDPMFQPYWGVMLGNVVHNFRSALDNVAWTLYKRGTTPNLSEGQEKNIYFPIAETRTKFNKSIKTKLPGVRREDIAMVRSTQPYKAGMRNLDRHVIWVLDELSRHDKHRAIHPVSPVPGSAAFQIGPAKDCIFRRVASRTPRAILQPGTEVMRIYVKKTGPDPHVDVQPHFTIDPSVNARLTLEEFLTRATDAISRVLYACADPPDSIKPITGFLPQKPQ